MGTKVETKRTWPSANTNALTKEELDEGWVRRRARFEATALPHLGTVHAAARRFAYRSAIDAEDLVQETFLRAYRTFDGFVPGTNARAWLLTILYSVFVNRYRRARREPESMATEDIERRFERLASASGAAEERERIARLDGASPELRSALARLPEALRSVLLLVDVEDLTYEEAALAIGCPVGTIRSRLSRARRQLYVELFEGAPSSSARSTGVDKEKRS